MSGNLKRIAAIGATGVVGLTIVGATAVPAFGVKLPPKTANTVAISGPASAKVGDKFPITCQAPANLAGGSLIVYQNGAIFPVTGIKVGSTGACNFRVVSGIAGPNKFDVAVKKAGKVYQSNAIKVQLKGNVSLSTKNMVKISGPKTVKQWQKINITCQAPAQTAGGKVIIYQNGAIFPVTNVKVGAGGVCNFWVKSGVLGANKFDLAVQKSGKVYQSNAISVNVTAK